MDEKVKLTAKQAMQMAIAESAKGKAFVSPNPAVGCVILTREGFLLSKGHHEKYGEAHAEANALRGLSAEDLRGAQVFVTLEPCAHQGKTPSCAKALAQLPVGKVIFGLVDPNPLVSGKGRQILLDAGIPCELYRNSYDAELENELEEACEEFLWNQRHKKVFVSLKIAASLDGKIALANGESKWITGPESREQVHRLRAEHDALLTGVGTLLRDDPSLDIRHPMISKTNKVIILDREGRGLSKAAELKLFKAHAASNLFWITGLTSTVAASFATSVQQGVRVLRGERTSRGGLHPAEVLDLLWVEGIRSVMIEGGARVAGSFLEAGLVNRLHLFQAPVVMGSAGALGWSEGFLVPEMAARPALKDLKAKTFGQDFYMTGLLRNPQTTVEFRSV